MASRPECCTVFPGMHNRDDEEPAVPLHDNGPGQKRDLNLEFLKVKARFLIIWRMQ